MGTPAASAAPSVSTVVQKPVSTSPPYSASLSLPQVAWPGHAAVAGRINAAIQAWAAAQVSAFAATVSKDLAGSAHLPASLPPSSLTITYQAGLVSAAVVSLHFTVEPYDRGQAGAVESPAGLTFDLATGSTYSLSGLFRPGAGYIPALAAQAGTGLQAFHPAGARCYLGRTPAATEASFGAWWLSASGLVLAFPSGTYTAAYCGAPTVTVPFAALSALAAPGSPLVGA